MGQMVYVCHSIISQSLLLKNKNCDMLYDLILKSLKRKLIIVNPYFSEGSSIYSFIYFAQILLILLLS